MLGVKIGEKLCKGLNFDLANIHFWCDSLTVISWINEHSRNLKPFVANKTSYIQSKVKGNQWRCVPSKENTADIVSRGRDATRLQGSVLWFKGSEFIQNSKESWQKLPNQIAKTSQYLTELKVN